MAKAEPLVVTLDPELISLLKEIRDLLYKSVAGEMEETASAVHKLAEGGTVHVPKDPSTGKFAPQKIVTGRMEVRGYGQIPAYNPPDYFTD